MPTSAYSSEDYLSAEDVLSHLSRNRELEFWLDGEHKSRDEMIKHGRERQALVIVRGLLIDEAEKSGGT